MIDLCDFQAIEETANQRMCEEKASDLYGVQERGGRCRGNFE